jgi:hypothetical protein
LFYNCLGRAGDACLQELGFREFSLMGCKPDFCQWALEGTCQIGIGDEIIYLPFWREWHQSKTLSVIEETWKQRNVWVSHRTPVSKKSDDEDVVTGVRGEGERRCESVVDEDRRRLLLWCVIYCV